LSNSSEITKNDRAWVQLFSKYKILDHIERNGYFEITATQINEFREARLMTKFDHRINLPKLFSDNNLAILPITRGSYIISKFEAYKDFEQLDDKITRASFPEYIESIDYKNITSEAIAINCAYVSNILADFLEDEELMPTVSGRMSSDTFSFYIRNITTNSNVPVKVVNSQMEIDGGYEGIRQLALIEAKNFISDDFLIRQLYYPYRLWNSKVSKKITPVFLVYSNGIFNLYEYEFQDPENYNSLVLVKQKNYSIEAVEICLDDIVAVLDQVRYIEEPEVAFPQADSFKRIINLCELLSQGNMTRDDITLNYAFDPRQTNYYTDAGRYLGLISKHKENGQIVFSLTEEGQRIVRSKYKTRQLKFVETVLKHKVFSETLRLYLQRSEMPTKGEIVNIMKKCDLYQVEAESTFYRRASTIASWINWILDLQR
jgi:predicted transcriptional regulator